MRQNSQNNFFHDRMFNAKTVNVERTKKNHSYAYF